jgi:hypothetical protein
MEHFRQRGAFGPVIGMDLKDVGHIVPPPNRYILGGMGRGIAAIADFLARGQPTGTWRLELFNPTEKPMDAALTVDPAFSLVKNRTMKASIPARGQTTVEME